MRSSTRNAYRMPWPARTSRPGGGRKVGEFHGGVARVNITPPPGVFASGYRLRAKPAWIIQDELWATALVVESDGRRVVLITADLLYLPRRWWVRCGKGSWSTPKLTRTASWCRVRILTRARKHRKVRCQSWAMRKAGRSKPMISTCEFSKKSWWGLRSLPGSSGSLSRSARGGENCAVA